MTETRPAVRISQAVPFFRVSDMAASLRFYVDGLGFVMKNQWTVDGQPRWCWLEHGGAALMLQQFPTEGHDSWVAQTPVGVGVSVCLMCEDALAVYENITRNGIQASRPFVGNGLWVTSVTDPDGYRLDFDSPTTVAEGTSFPA